HDPTAQESAAKNALPHAAQITMSRRPTSRPREAKPFTPLASSHVSERFYVVHLIDGTYELFRHFYGLRRFNKGVDRPYGAIVGVLQTVLQMMTSHSPMHISACFVRFRIQQKSSLS